jgi:predicted permease
VSTLIFARTWSRASELAVRTALGAARRRVVGQLFVEVLLLGAIAAAMGLGAANKVLSYASDPMFEMPFWIDLSPNPRTVAFVIILTLLVSAVSGLLPALKVTRRNLLGTLHAGRGFAFGGFGRAGAALLVVEIALSVALLNGAVTLARAFTSYIGEIPALPKKQVITAHLDFIQEPALRDRVIDALREIPGVVAAGAAAHLPRLDPPARIVAVEREVGEPAWAPQRAPAAAVGRGFLEAIGARAITGRLLVATDFAIGALPVVVVNQPFVDKFLRGRNAVGRRIRVAEDDASAVEPWREIVGVVPDLGLSAGDPSLAAGFYAPVRDETLYYVAVRTAGDPLMSVGAIRKAVATVDPMMQLDELMLLDDVGKGERAFLSGIASALTAMGAMALLLSIVGIYALLSFMVTRRTREIGIRVALGAARPQILKIVVGSALFYLALGGVIGSGLGLLFVGLRSLILIRMPEPGVWMPLTIFLTLAVAGATACWLPARRALGIRPSEALSSE